MKQKERDRRDEVILKENITGRQLVCPPKSKNKTKIKTKTKSKSNKEIILAVFNEDKAIIHYLDKKYDELILLTN